MELRPEKTEAIINRLKRAQGQLGGIIRMIEEGRDCKDVATQLSAASKAVGRAGFAVIATGLEQRLQDGSTDIKDLEKLFLSLA